MLTEIPINQLSESDRKKISSIQEEMKRRAQAPLIIDTIIEKVFNKGDDFIPELYSVVDNHPLYSRYPIRCIDIGKQKIYMVCTPEIEKLIYHPIQEQLFELAIVKNKLDKMNQQLNSIESMNFFQRLKFLVNHVLPGCKA